MADLRKETHGPGSMKDVNLVVIAYDNRVAKDSDQKITTHYLDARIHPGDRRAAGQATLALVSKRDPKSSSGYNNSARYSVGQFDAIKAAAGDNVAPLTNQAGEVVGSIYGVKADLLVNNGDVIANTKTLSASELSVGPDENGFSIQDQIFKASQASKAAREAAKAASTVEAEAVAPAVEEPAAEEPKPASKPAAKRTTTAKKATAAKPKPELVGATTATASSNEPELG